MMEVKKASLGIEELDRLLSGGIPEPSSLLILGDVGTGKSVLCQQFAYSQAKVGYKVVYFCIDNPPDEVKHNIETVILLTLNGTVKITTSGNYTT